MELIKFYIQDLSLDSIQVAEELLDQQHGIDISVFGLSGKNARCYWHWKFIEEQDCPKTRALLERTADMRLQLHLQREDIERIGTAIVSVLNAAGQSADAVA